MGLREWAAKEKVERGKVRLQWDGEDSTGIPKTKRRKANNLCLSDSRTGKLRHKITD